MTAKRTRKLPEPPETTLMPLAVVTDKNQLTLAEGLLANFPDADCFEVAIEDGRIVLTPYPIVTADDVRLKIAALGITEEDVHEAIRWARGR